MTQFPSALDTFVNPTATSKMNEVPHHALHSNANDAIAALQAKVGINGTSVNSTHDFKLSEVLGTAKAVASDNPALTDARAPTAHDHDGLYYTEAETDAFLAGKLASDHVSVTNARTPTAHSHPLAQITDAGTAASKNVPASGNASATEVVLGSDTRLGAGGGASSVFARVTGSNATTTGQTLVDIAGLTAALLANSVYEFEANLSVQASSTAGNQYGVQFSAAGSAVEAQISGTLAAATSRSDRISALNTAAPALVTSGATGGVRIQGIITTGANAGNLTIRHLKTTSGTSTVFINSFLRVLKL